jgi:hypothetical protein
MDQEHVGALEVAVDDACLVRGEEPFAELTHEREHLVRGERPGAAQQGGEGLALEQLHRQEADPLRAAGAGAQVEAHVEEAADVGVRHLACERDLPLELLQGPWFLGELSPEDLERHALAQLEILRLIDLAHATATEQASDAVAEGDQLVILEDPEVGGGRWRDRGELQRT